VTAGSTEPVLRVAGATRTLGAGAASVRALDDVSLRLDRGEVAVVTGASGSGKSTLLHAIAGLEPLDSGAVRVLGRDLAGLTAAEAAQLRRRHIGVVFQFFQLIPTLTAVQNVAMPLILDGMAAPTADARAAARLDEIGVGECAGRFVGELSGGQMQRVAIARATVAPVDLVLADEPSGNLDRSSGELVLAALRSAAAAGGAALIVVTHDDSLGLPSDRRFDMCDGRLTER
jgi:ABC-type lipoprotein export system ATPase subunit